MTVIRTSHTDGSVVAVAGGKGGCGKTTVTLGLALGLVRRGRRPLAVDADVGVPDLHIRAAVDPEPGLASLAAGEPPERVAQPSTAVPGVDVVAVGAASRCPPAALRRFGELARPVVVDCPAGAGPDAAAPLRAADACVLVTTTEPESRQDAAKTAAMADALDVPVVATVQRTTDGGDAPVASGGHAAGRSSHGATPAALSTDALSDGRVETVPTVDGRPLEHDALLDRFERLSLKLDGGEPARRRPASQ